MRPSKCLSFKSFFKFQTSLVPKEVLSGFQGVPYFLILDSALKLIAIKTENKDSPM